MAIQSEVNFGVKPESVSNRGTAQKKTASGIVLVPQPSDDPADPLNWPLWKKLCTLGLVTLAAFIGLAQALANQSGFVVQAALYHKTPVEISYSISAAIVGLAIGPLLWAPLSQRFGCPSVIFWGMLGTVACCIWSAEMTKRGQYTAFVVSRWLSGTFGSAPSTIGAQVILDLFFLHQRGKAFNLYTLATLFGTQAGPTIGGFILHRNPWPVQFWWVVGVEAAVAVLTFLFMQETSYKRGPAPQSYISDRLATFFPGSSERPEKHEWYAAFLIGICPVTLLAGGFLCIAFGWLVAVTTLLSVFLQSPLKDGGYAFTPIRNAEFSFAPWLGLLIAFIYGTLLNNRVALWTARRKNGGYWKPEYRLFPMLILPNLLLPSMLGLFGASLQYHLHYLVLATAVFLLEFCEIALVPVVINYVVECFTDHAAEVTTILNFDRLVLGLLVPFFIEPWKARVGVGWTFGMMAFFSVFAFLATYLLAWKGHRIRQMSLTRFGKSEEGRKVTEDGDDEEM